MSKKDYTHFIVTRRSDGGYRMNLITVYRGTLPWPFPKNVKTGNPVEKDSLEEVVLTACNFGYPVFFEDFLWWDRKLTEDVLKAVDKNEDFLNGKTNKD